MPRRDQFPSKKFLDNLAKGFAARVRARASKKTNSNTIKTNMFLRRKFSGKRQARWAVYIPHYWAVYLHDGTKGFTMPKGKWAVWFRNPRQDPRLSGGYPKRLVHKKRLRENKAFFKRNRKNMIFKKRVSSSPGEFFFDNQKGMRGMSQEASREGSAAMSAAVKEFLGDDLHIEETLVVSFGK